MNINEKSINTMRVLSAEMIEHAKSGHPGIALGAAPVLYTLYKDVLKVSPSQPNSPFRDRFVLSAGHGSSLLYATLHLFGFNVSMNDIKQFRQLGSITPGHPEIGITPGVDVSTGPLGQGVSNAVGLAMAERHLAATFNKKDIALFNNYTYVLTGDGCLQEGIANEALSLAGTHKLNKFILIYDDNKITIDGSTEKVFNQDTEKVFQGYGFNVIKVANGNDYKAIKEALLLAKKSADKPTAVIVSTRIGFGSLLEGSEKSHGSPLGAEGVSLLKQKLKITEKDFEVAQDVTEHFETIKINLQKNEDNWKIKLENYQKKYKQEYAEFEKYFNGLDYTKINVSNEINKDIATRDAGSMVLNELAKTVPNFFGGCADLIASTKAKVNNGGFFTSETPEGKNIMFGIREHAMAGICNGIALYGGLIPYASTFFVFADYMKASMRMSALQHLKVLYILTHDSIAVGEDGPTHQPIEQLAMLRSIPNMAVFRPCNLTETIAAYKTALTLNGPSTLVLTRQNLANLKTSEKEAYKGAYIVKKESKAEINGLIIAAGSEVSLALQAAENLEKKGYSIRVVSMLSQEIFNSQTKKYQVSILPETVKNVVTIEMGSTFGWHKYAGKDGLCIGIDEFGASGKASDVAAHFGFTPEKISKKIETYLKK